MKYTEMMFALTLLSKTPKCSVAIVCDKALHKDMMESIKEKCQLTAVPHTNSLKHSCGSSIQFLHTSLAGCQGKSYHHTFIYTSQQLDQYTIDQIKSVKSLNTHIVQRQLPPSPTPLMGLR